MAKGVSTKTEEKTQVLKGKKLRVAIIGCGGIAQTHLSTFKKIPEVEIVAGVDIVPERLDVVGCSSLCAFFRLEEDAQGN